MEPDTVAGPLTTVYVTAPLEAEVALTALRGAGFGIALDDFGTGFSSLGYLLRFPITKIKIDRSFVCGLPDDVKSATIVHALVALGRALGLKIVAEGVETEQQRQFLRVAGCHLLQGYLFSGAVTAQGIDDLLSLRAKASQPSSRASAATIAETAPHRA